MTYSKRFNGKRFYWYGWCSEESSALESKTKLELQGKLVIIEKGVGKYPDSKDMGWNIWYRPSK